MGARRTPARNSGRRHTIGQRRHCRRQQRPGTPRSRRPRWATLSGSLAALGTAAATAALATAHARRTPGLAAGSSGHCPDFGLPRARWLGPLGRGAPRRFASSSGGTRLGGSGSGAGSPGSPRRLRSGGHHISQGVGIGEIAGPLQRPGVLGRISNRQRFRADFPDLRACVTPQPGAGEGIVFGLRLYLRSPGPGGGRAPCWGWAGRIDALLGFGRHETLRVRDSSWSTRSCRGHSIGRAADTAYTTALPSPTGPGPVFRLSRPPAGAARATAAPGPRGARLRHCPRRCPGAAPRDNAATHARSRR